MQVKFIFPHWGQKGQPIAELVAKVKAKGYDGIEINTAATVEETPELVKALKDNGMTFVAQQWLPSQIETAAQYLARFEKNLHYISELRPQFINSHTGKDYFSFEDNCKVLDLAADFTHKTGIDIYHETHRGRFPFHTASTAPYLEAYPDLQFTDDFSHWCTVSESMLSDQPGIMEAVVPRVKYIHARVGFEHSPQVNDPRAPEWQAHVDRFLGWWDAIAAHQFEQGATELYICPEFGPPPYLPVMPYSREPLADQWEINDWVFGVLKGRYKSYTEA